MNIVVKGRTRAELKVSLKPHVNAQVWFFAIFVVWTYRKNDENCQLWLGFSTAIFLEEQLHSLAPKGFQIWLELVSKVCPKTSKWIWDPISFQAPTSSKLEIVSKFCWQSEPMWNLCSIDLSSSLLPVLNPRFSCELDINCCFWFSRFLERSSLSKNDGLDIWMMHFTWSTQARSMNYFVYSLPWMVGHYRFLFHFPYLVTNFSVNKSRCWITGGTTAAAKCVVQTHSASEWQSLELGTMRMDVFCFFNYW